MIVLLALSDVASACSCAARSAAERMASADVVFQGRADAVESILLPPAALAFGPTERAAFAVEAWWKGGDARQATVEYGWGESSCGLEVKAGETWVIYGHLSGGCCSARAPTPGSGTWRG